MTSEVREARVRAHAKINLGIRVLHRRPDDFHEIRTIFQTISLADELRIRYLPARRTSISIEGDAQIADNLVERAARACLGQMRLTARVEFALTKKIPMGAGLGGGSSDAAAVMLALPVLAGRILPMSRLVPLAESLGSDVPFFLLGGTAVGLGKGEELYPLPELPARTGVLIAPGVHISTPSAYRGLSGTLTSSAAKLLDFQRTASGPLNVPLLNDFEAVVFVQHPKLRRLKAKLIELGASPALMTGSGSAIFGLFNDSETTARVVQSLGAENVYRIALLNRARYRSEWLRRLKPHVTTNLWPPRSLYAR
jgi:4-diphosphocytidyl-2-C-methyl-D-erythritol kinase